jgi:rubrerythrin
MTDRYSKAIEEQGEKSAFVCESCGHHNIPKAGKEAAKQSEVKDRFSEAVKEEGEKSAFVCESCGHRQGAK